MTHVFSSLHQRASKFHTFLENAHSQERYCRIRRYVVFQNLTVFLANWHQHQLSNAKKSFLIELYNFNPFWMIFNLQSDSYLAKTTSYMQNYTTICDNFTGNSEIHKRKRLQKERDRKRKARHAIIWQKERRSSVLLIIT